MDIKFVSLLVIGLAAIFSVNAFTVNSRHHHRALDDDLEDFFSLMPKDEILHILMEYLKHDTEVQYVVKYILSSEFRELVEDIKSIPCVIDFINYLQESGLDVHFVVSLLHEFIRIPSQFNPWESRFTVTGGAVGLIGDIKAILPVEDIKAMHQKKLKTSKEFKNLIERFQSSEFQIVLDELCANLEFQKVVIKAEEMGVNVKALTDILFTVLGIKFSEHRINIMSRGLNEDLVDFLALIPKEKIVKIFFEYLKYDAEVQYAVEYIQSSEFYELVKAIESIPDVINFYNYLYESGVNVYHWVNQLHEFIGLPPLIPPKTSVYKITGGVSGLIADIKAILPIEDIKSLYHEKLKISSEFRLLIEHLRSPKFQAVVDALLANSEFQKIVKKVKEFGVDVKAIAELLFTVLGIQFPSIYSESIILHKEKLQSDSAYEIFTKRIHPNQFKGILSVIISTHAFKVTAANFQSSDFDTKLFIGAGNYFPNFHSSVSLERTLEEDMDDFIHLMPLKEIANITLRYVLHDSQVQEAVRYIHSQDFRELAIKLQHDPQVYEFLVYFDDSGARVIDLIDILNELLNIPAFPLSKNYVKNCDYMDGVEKMLKDICAIISFNAIEAMYKDKMVNSEEFRYFIERIHNPAFQRIIDKMVLNENVIELGYQAQLHGINIEMISKFLAELFGIKFP